ncbi:MAG: type II CAAX endopeptidase family protein [Candidatus Udaeobacter sp.]
MPSASLLAAPGAAPSIAFGVLSLLYVLVSAYVYISLIHQISAQTSNPVGTGASARIFGLPEAILASVLILFLLLNIGASISRPSNDFSASNLLGNFLLMIFVVLTIVTFLQLRRFDLASLGGFSRISFIRALSTGAILLFFAYPLILWSDIITQRLFRGGSSKQNIVEFFSGSRTIDQRMMIIVFAVAIAPVIEEFLFRFFLYNVIKRYFGRLLGVVLSALLFAAAHAHFPSFVPLFVLGGCFAIAYEWSGSILVAMTMHSLFNSVTLTALAFPDIFSP